MGSNAWDYINPLDVEQLSKEFDAAEPFRFVVVDNFLRPEFVRDVCRAYPSYEEAQQLRDREFNAVNEYRKVQIVEADSFPEPVRLLSESLASAELRQTLTEITGISDLLADPELNGAGMHLMESGSRLGLHVDFNTLGDRLYRRLNIILYLNEQWKTDWGGALDIWDPQIRRCEHLVPPLMNRAVMFNTVPRSYHGVLPVSCPPDRTRNTFASFYYTTAIPADWEGKNGTIWGYRPGEKFRQYVETVPDRFAKGVIAPLRRARRKLRGR